MRSERMGEGAEAEVGGRGSKRARRGFDREGEMGGEAGRERERLWGE
jgi:hypothetical protein